MPERCQCSGRGAAGMPGRAQRRRGARPRLRRLRSAELSLRALGGRFEPGTRSDGAAGRCRLRVRRRASRMIAMPIPTMITAAAAAMPIALPGEMPEPLVEVPADAATVVAGAVAAVVFTGGVVSAPPSAFVLVELVADVLDAEACFFFAAWATAGIAAAGPAASTSAASAAGVRRATRLILTSAPRTNSPVTAPLPGPAARAQRSEASGPDMAGVSWSVLYGFSESCTSSWYTLSTFTDQMSWLAPCRMLSTARIAVSIEWSELL